MSHEFDALRVNAFREYAAMGGRGISNKLSQKETAGNCEIIWKILKVFVVCVVALDSEARRLGCCSLTPTSYGFSLRIPPLNPLPQHLQDNLHTLLPYTTHHRSLQQQPLSPKAICPLNHICRVILNT